jgi:nitroreductase
MDVITAIKSRYTVRAFKPLPVSKELLEELLNIAIRAPSSSNTQTWEFAVVGGETMEELRQVLVSKVLGNQERKPEIPRAEWPPFYHERGKENGLRLFQLLKISREDKEKQLQWTARMHDFFGAPNCIIVYTDKETNQWALFNSALVIQNITLVALKYGLGTAILASVMGYPDEIKRILNIPSSKQLIVGIAIGYPDLQDMTNEFRSNRVPLEDICSWHGF